MKLLEDAAGLGDTEAMSDLEAVYAAGLEGSPSSLKSKQQSISKWESVLTNRIAETLDYCNKAKADMRSEAPERTIRYVLPGEAHGWQSFTCVAAFLAEERPDEPVQEVLYDLDGKPLDTWTYTMYRRSPNAKPAVVRASLMEEIMRRANEQAIVAAMLKKVMPDK